MPTNNTTNLEDRDPIDQIFDDFYDGVFIEELPKAKAALNAHILREMKTELKTLKKSIRGEDPDQYRPNDSVSMSYVEEVIDAHLAAAQRKYGGSDE